MTNIMLCSATESNPLGTIVKALLNANKMGNALEHNQFKSLMDVFLSSKMLVRNPVHSYYHELFGRLLTKNVLSIAFFNPDFMETLNLDDELSW